MCHPVEIHRPEASRRAAGRAHRGADEALGRVMRLVRRLVAGLRAWLAGESVTGSTQTQVTHG